MEMQITARNFEVSSALKEYVEKRLSKLEHFYDGYTHAHVILRDGDDPAARKAAEINLNIRRQRLCAQGAAASYEKAIDDCVKRLRRQVIKHKEKLQSRKKDSYR